MPRARTAGSHLGACGSYTELGPPDSTMPVGSSLRISSSVVVHGRTEEKTCCSRMRRAMSCVYWPPKSSTTIPPRSFIRPPGALAPSSPQLFDSSAPEPSNSARIRQLSTVDHGLPASFLLLLLLLLLFCLCLHPTTTLTSLSRTTIFFTT